MCMRDAAVVVGGAGHLRSLVWSTGADALAGHLTCLPPKARRLRAAGRHGASMVPRSTLAPRLRALAGKCAPPTSARARIATKLTGAVPYAPPLARATFPAPIRGRASRRTRNNRQWPDRRRRNPRPSRHVCPDRSVGDVPAQPRTLPIVRYDLLHPHPSGASAPPPSGRAPDAAAGGAQHGRNREREHTIAPPRWWWRRPLEQHAGLGDPRTVGTRTRPVPGVSSPPRRPLLTIGIPTYNRVGTLRRAVDSALKQGGGDLEILVADNASTDDTERYCRALAEREPVVRYIRQSVNLGPTANFNTVLRQARGDYFLFLGDDDWLHPSYSERCIAWLRAHPGCAMAGGHPRYLRDDGAVAYGRPISLSHTSPARRVSTYYRVVEDGATIYGVIPRHIVDRLTDIRNVIGNDWMFVSEVAALGKVAALPDVHLYRSLDGMSSQYRAMVKSLNLPAAQGRLPYAPAAFACATDLLWRSAVHRRTFSARTRVALALLCTATIIRRQLWLGVLGLGRLPLARGPFGAAKSVYYFLNRWTGGRLALRIPGQSTVVGRRTRSSVKSGPDG